jgi:hypothetical protein
MRIELILEKNHRRAARERFQLARREMNTELVRWLRDVDRAKVEADVTAAVVRQLTRLLRGQGCRT